MCRKLAANLFHQSIRRRATLTCCLDKRNSAPSNHLAKPKRSLAELGDDDEAVKPNFVKRRRLQYLDDDSETSVESLNSVPDSRCVSSSAYSETTFFDTDGKLSWDSSKVPDLDSPSDSSDIFEDYKAGEGIALAEGAPPEFVDFDELIENVSVIDTLLSTDTWRSFTTLRNHFQFEIGPDVETIQPEFVLASRFDIPMLFNLLSDDSCSPVTLYF